MSMLTDSIFFLHPPLIHSVTHPLWKYLPRHLCSICNMSYVMCYMSRVMCTVSCVPCYVYRVTCHIWKIYILTNLLFSIFFGQIGEASWWRVCYHWGLPRLVSLLAKLFKNLKKKFKYPGKSMRVGWFYRVSKKIVLSIIQPNLNHFWICKQKKFVHILK